MHQFQDSRPGGGPAHDRQLAEAMRLFQVGKLAKAERLCAQVQRKDPRNALALALMGAAQCDRGRNEYGIKLLDQSVAIRDDPVVRRMLGDALLRCGRAAEAVPHFTAARDAAPDNVAAGFGLAVALQDSGRSPEALAALRHVLTLEPTDVAVLIDIGTRLGRVDALDEAVVAHARAVALRPDLAETHCNLGVTLLHRDLPLEAAAELRAALALRPDFPEAWSNLGSALLESGEVAAALDAFRRAVAQHPASAPLWCNLANALHRAGRLDAALGAFDQGLARDPGFAEGHFGRAHILLARGEYEAGWAEYEWRHHVPRLAGRRFAQPQWDGEELGGRIILLHAEGGLGDSLQFVRYVPLVVARGGRVVLEVQPPLQRLCKSLPGVSQILSFGAALPAFDLQCSLFSLPRGFRTTLDTIPDRPYLAADPVLAAAWRDRLGPTGGLRIGLVWAGGAALGAAATSRADHRRSMHLPDFASLADVAGVQLFSLQLGPPAAQLAEATFAIQNPMAAVTDFADTAAVVANLDLVISVDTAVAHLAGAMGKPVWLLSRFDACWRWLRDRSDSPWYPSLRVYTQAEPGEWAPVVTRVRADLAQSVGSVTAQ